MMTLSLKQTDKAYPSCQASIAINDHCLTVLVDTGASKSVLDHRAWKPVSASCARMSAADLALFGANGVLSVLAGPPSTQSLCIVMTIYQRRTSCSLSYIIKLWLICMENTKESPNRPHTLGVLSYLYSLLFTSGGSTHVFGTDEDTRGSTYCFTPPSCQW